MIIRNSDMETLINKSQGKKVVCFGAGYYLNWLCEIFEEVNFWERIDAIVDNSLEKQGASYEYKDKKKLIQSPAEYLSGLGDNVVIIITTMYFYEIFKQLKSMPNLSGAQCYLYTLLAARPPKYEFPKRGNGKMLIPKKIHYCWFGGNRIPEEFTGYMDTWRKYCPDYEIIKWDESNYDITKNKYMYDAYKSKKWGFASDYARLDILYCHGGIYLDTDVELLRSLDDLLYDEAFCGVDLPNMINMGLGFGAVPGFKIIKEWLDMYENIAFINPDGSLNLAPCSNYQSETLKKHAVAGVFRPMLIDGLRIYPPDVLSPKSTQNWNTFFTVNSYSNHHFSSTWYDDEKFRIRKLFSELVKEFIDEAKDF